MNPDRRPRALALAGLLLAACATRPASTPKSSPASPTADEPPVATFSIVAWDPDTQELGIAVQSKFLGVGAVVPWAKAGVGAIATQSYANTSYGPRGLELLVAGRTAQEVVDALTKDDAGRDQRQVGIVSAKGDAATFTGPRCLDWAGGQVGEHFCVQGNILAGEAVVEAMAKGFEESTGEDLGERLIDALAAGQAAGGDKRGVQSAALLVVREGWGYGGNDRYRDVRVDDHEKPIDELRRIYTLHKRTFSRRR